MSPEQIKELVNQLSFWLRVFGVTVIVGETAYLLWRFKKIYWRETAINLATGVIAVMAQMVIKTYIIADLHTTVFNKYKLFDFGIHWYTFVLGFFMYTFIQFATHYYYHKVRIFWCLHEVHHSAIQMNATTGLRTSIFDLIALDIFFLLMPFVGINPVVYLLLYTLNKFWGTFIHINENIVNKIPWLEYIMTTPSNHHIHHARNIQYLDRNYGEVIPWYDMIFKTYAKEEEKPVYGTLSVQTEIGFWDSQLHEFKKLWKDVKSTPKLKHKIAYFFMPPGWHPHSNKGTAKYIQDAYFKNLKEADQ